VSPLFNSYNGISVGEGGATGRVAGGSGFEFGVDPSADPELAMALRMSMEEESNRLDRQRREREEAEKKEKRIRRG
jgi:26S proteasome regulatory subunit N10